MNPYPHWCKGVAFYVIVTFFVTNIGYSQSIVPPDARQTSSPTTEQEIPLQFKVPGDLGSIQSEFTAQADKPFIVYLQDAHAILDAQTNIRKLIDFLKKQYGFDLVAIEGVKDKMDPLLFQTFPDSFVRARVLDQYLKKAELSGAALAAAQDGEGRGYFGLEDWQLYEANYAAYLHGIIARDKFLEKLTELTEATDERRKAVYSAGHSEYHEKVVGFRREKLQLFDFLNYLATIPELKAKAVKYPDLSKLIGSLGEERPEQEQTLDVSVRQMAEAFKKKYVAMLDREQSMAFTKNYQDYRTGKIEVSVFLAFLVDAGNRLGLKSRLTPLMKKALGQQETLMSIKGTRLFDEIELLIRDAESVWKDGEDAAILADRYRKLWLLENLAKMELTPEQWSDYQKEPEAYLALLESCRENAEPAIEFYRIALERDHVFHEKLTSLLAEQKSRRAVVITGGFHAKGFEEQLKNAGYSYAIVMPKISTLEGQEYYEDVMAGKISYRRSGGESFYEAFAKDCSERLLAELDAPAFSKDVKLWRDNLLRELAKQGRLSEAGNYTGYIDRLIAVSVKRFGAAYSDKSREETLTAIRTELDKFRDSKLNEFWKKIKRKISLAVEQLGVLRQDGDVTAEKVGDILRGNGLSALSPSAAYPFAKTSNRPLDQYLAGKLPPFKRTEMKILATPAQIRDELRQIAAQAPANLSKLPAVQSAAKNLSDIGQTSNILGTELSQTPPLAVRREIHRIVSEVSSQVQHNTANINTPASVVAGAMLAAMDTREPAAAAATASGFSISGQSDKIVAGGPETTASSGSSVRHGQGDEAMRPIDANPKNGMPVSVTAGRTFEDAIITSTTPSMHTESKQGSKKRFEVRATEATTGNFILNFSQKLNKVLIIGCMAPIFAFRIFEHFRLVYFGTRRDRDTVSENVERVTAGIVLGSLLIVLPLAFIFNALILLWKKYPIFKNFILGNQFYLKVFSLSQGNVPREDIMWRFELEHLDELWQEMSPKARSSAIKDLMDAYNRGRIPTTDYFRKYLLAAPLSQTTGSESASFDSNQSSAPNVNDAVPQNNLAESKIAQSNAETLKLPDVYRSHMEDPAKVNDFAMWIAASVLDIQDRTSSEALIAALMSAISASPDLAGRQFCNALQLLLDNSHPISVRLNAARLLVRLGVTNEKTLMETVLAALSKFSSLAPPEQERERLPVSHSITEIFDDVMTAINDAPDRTNRLRSLFDCIRASAEIFDQSGLFMTLLAEESQALSWLAEDASSTLAYEVFNHQNKRQVHLPQWRDPFISLFESAATDEQRSMILEFIAPIDQRFAGKVALNESNNPFLRVRAAIVALRIAQDRFPPDKAVLFLKRVAASLPIEEMMGLKDGSRQLLSETSWMQYAHRYAVPVSHLLQSYGLLLAFYVSDLMQASDKETVNFLYHNVSYGGVHLDPLNPALQIDNAFSNFQFGHGYLNRNIYPYGLVTAMHEMGHANLNNLVRVGVLSYGAWNAAQAVGEVAADLHELLVYLAAGEGWISYQNNIRNQDDFIRSGDSHRDIESHRLGRSTLARFCEDDQVQDDEWPGILHHFVRKIAAAKVPEEKIDGDRLNWRQIFRFSWNRTVVALNSVKALWHMLWVSRGTNMILRDLREARSKARAEPVLYFDISEYFSNWQKADFDNRTGIIFPAQPRQEMRWGNDLPTEITVPDTVEQNDVADYLIRELGLTLVSQGISFDVFTSERYPPYVFKLANQKERFATARFNLHSQKNSKVQRRRIAAKLGEAGSPEKFVTIRYNGSALKLTYQAKQEHFLGSYGRTLSPGERGRLRHWARQFMMRMVWGKGFFDADPFEDDLALVPGDEPRYRIIDTDYVYELPRSSRDAVYEFLRSRNTDQRGIHEMSPAEFFWSNLVFNTGSQELGEQRFVRKSEGLGKRARFLSDSFFPSSDPGAKARFGRLYDVFAAATNNARLKKKALEKKYRENQRSQVDDALRLKGIQNRFLRGFVRLMIVLLTWRQLPFVTGSIQKWIGLDDVVEKQVKTAFCAVLDTDSIRADLDRETGRLADLIWKAMVRSGTASEQAASAPSQARAELREDNDATVLAVDLMPSDVSYEEIQKGVADKARALAEGMNAKLAKLSEKISFLGFNITIVPMKIAIRGFKEASKATTASEVIDRMFEEFGVLPKIRELAEAAIREKIAAWKPGQHFDWRTVYIYTHELHNLETIFPVLIPILNDQLRSVIHPDGSVNPNDAFHRMMTLLSIFGNHSDRKTFAALWNEISDENLWTVRDYLFSWLQANPQSAVLQPAYTRGVIDGLTALTKFDDNILSEDVVSDYLASYLSHGLSYYGANSKSSVPFGEALAKFADILDEWPAKQSVLDRWQDKSVLIVARQRMTEELSILMHRRVGKVQETVARIQQLADRIATLDDLLLPAGTLRYERSRERADRIENGIKRQRTATRDYLLNWLDADFPIDQISIPDMHQVIDHLKELNKMDSGLLSLDVVAERIASYLSRHIELYWTNYPDHEQFEEILFNFHEMLRRWPAKQSVLDRWQDKSILTQIRERMLRELSTEIDTSRETLDAILLRKKLLIMHILDLDDFLLPATTPRDQRQSQRADGVSESVAATRETFMRDLDFQTAAIGMIRFIEDHPGSSVDETLTAFAKACPDYYQDMSKSEALRIREMLMTYILNRQKVGYLRSQVVLVKGDDQIRERIFHAASESDRNDIASNTNLRNFLTAVLGFDPLAVTYPWSIGVSFTPDTVFIKLNDLSYRHVNWHNYPGSGKSPDIKVTEEQLLNHETKSGGFFPSDWDNLFAAMKISGLLFFERGSGSEAPVIKNLNRSAIFWHEWFHHFFQEYGGRKYFEKFAMSKRHQWIAKDYLLRYQNEMLANAYEGVFGSFDVADWIEYYADKYREGKTADEIEPGLKHKLEDAIAAVRMIMRAESLRLQILQGLSADDADAFANDYAVVVLLNVPFTEIRTLRFIASEIYHQTSLGLAAEWDREREVSARIKLVDEIKDFVLKATDAMQKEEDRRIAQTPLRPPFRGRERLLFIDIEKTLIPRLAAQAQHVNLRRWSNHFSGLTWADGYTRLDQLCAEAKQGLQDPDHERRQLDQFLADFYQEVLGYSYVPGAISALNMAQVSNQIEARLAQEARSQDELALASEAAEIIVTGLARSVPLLETIDRTVAMAKKMDALSSSAVRTEMRLLLEKFIPRKGAEVVETMEGSSAADLGPGWTVLDEAVKERVQAFAGRISPEVMQELVNQLAQVYPPLRLTVLRALDEALTAEAQEHPRILSEVMEPYLPKPLGRRQLMIDRQGLSLWHTSYQKMGPEAPLVRYVSRSRMIVINSDRVDRDYNQYDRRFPQLLNMLYPAELQADLDENAHFFTSNLYSGNDMRIPRLLYWLAKRVGFIQTVAQYYLSSKIASRRILGNAVNKLFDWYHRTDERVSSVPNTLAGRLILQGLWLIISPFVLLWAFIHSLISGLPVAVDNQSIIPSRARDAENFSETLRDRHLVPRFDFHYGFKDDELESHRDAVNRIFADFKTLIAPEFQGSLWEFIDLLPDDRWVLRNGIPELVMKLMTQLKDHDSREAKLCKMILMNMMLKRAELTNRLAELLPCLQSLVDEESAAIIARIQDFFYKPGAYVSALHFEWSELYVRFIEEMFMDTDRNSVLSRFSEICGLSQQQPPAIRKYITLVSKFPNLAGTRITRIFGVPAVFAQMTPAQLKSWFSQDSSLRPEIDHGRLGTVKLVPVNSLTPEQVNAFYNPNADALRTAHYRGDPAYGEQPTALDYGRLHPNARKWLALAYLMYSERYRTDSRANHSADTANRKFAKRLQGAERNAVPFKGIEAHGIGRTLDQQRTGVRMNWEALRHVIYDENLATEAIGTETKRDEFAMNTDVAVINEDLQYSTAARFGTLIILYDPERLEKWGGGAFRSAKADGSPFLGARLSFLVRPRNYASGIVIENDASVRKSDRPNPDNLRRLKHVIAEGYFYIPVFSMSGELMFTPEDYDRLAALKRGLPLVGASAANIEPDELRQVFDVPTAEIEARIVALDRQIPENMRIPWGTIFSTSEARGRLGEHISAAIHNAAQVPQYGGMTDVEKVEVQLALLLHDIGKSQAAYQQLAPLLAQRYPQEFENGQNNGDHTRRSELMARIILDGFRKRWNISNASYQRILAAVRLHSFVTDRMQKKELAPVDIHEQLMGAMPRNLDERGQQQLLRVLYVVNKADALLTVSKLSPEFDQVYILDDLFGQQTQAANERKELRDSHSQVNVDFPDQLLESLHLGDILTSIGNQIGYVYQELPDIAINLGTDFKAALRGFIETHLSGTDFISLPEDRRMEVPAYRRLVKIIHYLEVYDEILRDGIKHEVRPHAENAELLWSAWMARLGVRPSDEVRAKNLFRSLFSKALLDTRSIENWRITFLPAQKAEIEELSQLIGRDVSTDLADMFLEPALFFHDSPDVDDIRLARSARGGFYAMGFTNSRLSAASSYIQSLLQLPIAEDEEIASHMPEHPKNLFATHATQPDYLASMAVLGYMGFEAAQEDVAEVGRFSGGVMPGTSFQVGQVQRTFGQLPNPIAKDDPLYNTHFPEGYNFFQMVTERPNGEFGVFIPYHEMLQASYGRSVGLYTQGAWYIRRGHFVRKIAELGYPGAQQWKRTIGEKLSGEWLEENVDGDLTHWPSPKHHGLDEMRRAVALWRAMGVASTGHEPFFLEAMNGGEQQGEVLVSNSRDGKALELYGQAPHTMLMVPRAELGNYISLVIAKALEKQNSAAVRSRIEKAGGIRNFLRQILSAVVPYEEPNLQLAMAALENADLDQVLQNANQTVFTRLDAMLPSIQLPELSQTTLPSSDERVEMRAVDEAAGITRALSAALQSLQQNNTPENARATLKTVLRLYGGSTRTDTAKAILTVITDLEKKIGMSIDEYYEGVLNEIWMSEAADAQSLIESRLLCRAIKVRYQGANEQSVVPENLAVLIQDIEDKQSAPAPPEVQADSSGEGSSFASMSVADVDIDDASVLAEKRKNINSNVEKIVTQMAVNDPAARRGFNRLMDSMIRKVGRRGTSGEKGSPVHTDLARWMVLRLEQELNNAAKKIGEKNWRKAFPEFEDIFDQIEQLSLEVFHQTFADAAAESTRLDASQYQRDRTLIKGELERMNALVGQGRSFTASQIDKLSTELAKLFARRYLISALNDDPANVVLYKADLGNFKYPLQWNTISSVGGLERDSARKEILWRVYQFWEVHTRFVENNVVRHTSAQIAFEIPFGRKGSQRPGQTGGAGLHVTYPSVAKSEEVLAAGEIMSLLPEGLHNDLIGEGVLSAGIVVGKPNERPHYDRWNRTMVLSLEHMTMRHFMEAFLHELGHAGDFYCKTHKDLWDKILADLKNDRYAISIFGFDAEDRQKYIRNYSTELFAETFMHFILHGEEFRNGFIHHRGPNPDPKLTAVWKRLYNFYRDQVFHGHEYIRDAQTGRLVMRTKDGKVVPFPALSLPGAPAQSAANVQEAGPGSGRYRLDAGNSGFEFNITGNTLIYQKEGGEAVRLPFPPGSVLHAGRDDNECPIGLPAGDGHISRTHFLLERMVDGSVEFLNNSKNGTDYNGKQYSIADGWIRMQPVHEEGVVPAPALPSAVEENKGELPDVGTPVESEVFLYRRLRLEETSFQFRVAGDQLIYTDFNGLSQQHPFPPGTDLTVGSGEISKIRIAGQNVAGRHLKLRRNQNGTISFRRIGHSKTAYKGVGMDDAANFESQFHPDSEGWVEMNPQMPSMTREQVQRLRQLLLKRPDTAPSESRVRRLLMGPTPLVVARDANQVFIVLGTIENPIGAGAFTIGDNPVDVNLGRLADFSDLDSDFSKMPQTSRRHAQLHSLPDGSVWLTDLDSGNGTYDVDDNYVRLIKGPHMIIPALNNERLSFNESRREMRQANLNPHNSSESPGKVAEEADDFIDNVVAREPDSNVPFPFSRYDYRFENLERYSENPRAVFELLEQKEPGFVARIRQQGMALLHGQYQSVGDFNDQEAERRGALDTLQVIVNLEDHDQSTRDKADLSSPSAKKARLLTDIEVLNEVSSRARQYIIQNPGASYEDILQAVMPAGGMVADQLTADGRGAVRAAILRYLNDHRKIEALRRISGAVDSKIYKSTDNDHAALLSAHEELKNPAFGRLLTSLLGFNPLELRAPFFIAITFLPDTILINADRATYNRSRAITDGKRTLVQIMNNPYDFPESTGGHFAPQVTRNYQGMRLHELLTFERLDFSMQPTAVSDETNLSRDDSKIPAVIDKDSRTAIHEWHHKFFEAYTKKSQLHNYFNRAGVFNYSSAWTRDAVYRHKNFQNELLSLAFDGRLPDYSDSDMEGWIIFYRIYYSIPLSPKKHAQLKTALKIIQNIIKIKKIDYRTRLNLSDEDALRRASEFAASILLIVPWMKVNELKMLSNVIASRVMRRMERNAVKGVAGREDILSETSEDALLVAQIVKESTRKQRPVKPIKREGESLPYYGGYLTLDSLSYSARIEALLRDKIAGMTLLEGSSISVMALDGTSTGTYQVETNYRKEGVPIWSRQDAFREYAIGRDVLTDEQVLIVKIERDDRLAILESVRKMNLSAAVRFRAVGHFVALDGTIEPVYVVDYHPLSLQFSLAFQTAPDVSGILRNASRIGADLLEIQGNGAVHGDVQYQNIHLNENGDWLLTDFGDPRNVKDVEGLASLVYGTLTGTLINHATWGTGAATVTGWGYRDPENPDSFKVLRPEDSAKEIARLAAVPGITPELANLIWKGLMGEIHLSDFVARLETFEQPSRNGRVIGIPSLTENGLEFADGAQERRRGEMRDVNLNARGSLETPIVVAESVLDKMIEMIKAGDDQESPFFARERGLLLFGRDGVVTHYEEGFDADETDSLFRSRRSADGTVEYSEDLALKLRDQEGLVFMGYFNNLSNRGDLIPMRKELIAPGQNEYFAYSWNHGKNVFNEVEQKQAKPWTRLTVDQLPAPPLMFVGGVARQVGLAIEAFRMDPLTVPGDEDSAQYKVVALPITIAQAGISQASTDGRNEVRAEPDGGVENKIYSLSYREQTQYEILTDALLRYFAYYQHRAQKSPNQQEIRIMIQKLEAAGLKPADVLLAMMRSRSRQKVQPLLETLHRDIAERVSDFISVRAVNLKQIQPEMTFGRGRLFEARLKTLSGDSSFDVIIRLEPSPIGNIFTDVYIKLANGHYVKLDPNAGTDERVSAILTHIRSAIAMLHGSEHEGVPMSNAAVYTGVSSAHELRLLIDASPESIRLIAHANGGSIGTSTDVLVVSRSGEVTAAAYSHELGLILMPPTSSLTQFTLRTGLPHEAAHGLYQSLRGSDEHQREDGTFHYSGKLAQIQDFLMTGHANLFEAILSQTGYRSILKTFLQNPGLIPDSLLGEAFAYILGAITSRDPVVRIGTSEYHITADDIQFVETVLDIPIPNQYKFLIFEKTTTPDPRTIEDLYSKCKLQLTDTVNNASGMDDFLVRSAEFQRGRSYPVHLNDAATSETPPRLPEPRLNEKKRLEMRGHEVAVFDGEHSNGNSNLKELMLILIEDGQNKAEQYILTRQKTWFNLKKTEFTENLNRTLLGPLEQAESSDDMIQTVISEEYKQQVIAGLQAEIRNAIITETDIDQLVSRILSLLVLGGAEAMNGAFTGGLPMTQTPLSDEARQAVVAMTDRIERATIEMATNYKGPKVTFVSNFLNDKEFMAMILDGASKMPILRALMLADDGNKVDKSMRGKLPGLVMMPTLAKLRKQMRSSDLLDEVMVGLPTGGQLLTEGADLGIFSILLDHAQIQGIQDPDLKKLAVKSVFYALMQYAVLNENVRKEIDTNPSLLLQQLERSGLPIFIGLSGNHLAMQLAQLAEFIEQVKAVKSAA